MSTQQNEKNSDISKQTDYQSGEIFLDLAKTDYQQEFDRANTMDQKVGIALPVIATYFFLLLRFQDVKELFNDKPNTSSIGSFLFSFIPPILYVISLGLAVISLLFLFYALVNQIYNKVDISSFNTKKSLSYPPSTFSAVISTLFIQSTQKNMNTNDKRFIAFKHGWICALISLIVFTLYVVFYYE